MQIENYGALERAKKVLESPLPPKRASKKAKFSHAMKRQQARERLMLSGWRHRDAGWAR